MKRLLLMLILPLLAGAAEGIRISEMTPTSNPSTNTWIIVSDLGSGVTRRMNLQIAGDWWMMLNPYISDLGTDGVLEDARMPSSITRDSEWDSSAEIQAAVGADRSGSGRLMFDTDPQVKNSLILTSNTVQRLALLPENSDLVFAREFDPELGFSGIFMRIEGQPAGPTNVLVTLPLEAEDGIVTPGPLYVTDGLYKTGSGKIVYDTEPYLTGPTINGFANAQHTHVDGPTGGRLGPASLDPAAAYSFGSAAMGSAAVTNGLEVGGDLTVGGTNVVSDYRTNLVNSARTAGVWDFYDDFERPDTAAGQLGVSASGVQWYFADPSGGGSPGTNAAVRGGRLVPNHKVDDPKVYYAASQIASHKPQAIRIGAEIVWTDLPGTYASQASLIIAGQTNSGAASWGVHTRFNRSGWALGYIDGDVNFVDLATGTYASGSTLAFNVPHYVEIAIDPLGASATFAGEHVRVENTNFWHFAMNTTADRNWCIWEHYSQDPSNMTDLMEFESVWAGGSLLPAGMQTNYYGPTMRLASQLSPSAYAELLMDRTSLDGFFRLRANETTYPSFVNIQGTNTSSSGDINWLRIEGTVNQSGSAGYRAIRVIVDEQAVGSGGRMTFASGPAGTTVPTFSVDLDGNVVASGDVALDGNITANDFTIGPYTGIVSSNMLWVDRLGSDVTAVRGRVDRPYATIQGAVNAAVSGDTIVVRSGTWSFNRLGVPVAGEYSSHSSANILVKGFTNLTLRGEGAVIRTIPGSYELGNVLSITDCTNVTVSGFTFQGAGCDPVITSGIVGEIVLWGTNRNVTIADCQFYDYPNHGVLMSQNAKTSYDTLVVDCRFVRGGTSRHATLVVDGTAVASTGPGMRVVNCYMEDLVRGVEIEGPGPAPYGYALIANNFMTNIWNAGVVILNTSGDANLLTDVNIVGNSIYGHNTLVRSSTYQFGITSSGGRRFTIANNQIRGMYNAGVHLSTTHSRSSDILISGNLLSANGTNIVFRDNEYYTHTNIVVANNIIQSNSIAGPNVRAAGRYLTFRGNTITGNSTAPGILLADSLHPLHSVHPLFEGNTFMGVNPAIEIASGVQGAVVFGNTVADASTRLTDAGTSTVKVFPWTDGTDADMGDALPAGDDGQVLTLASGSPVWQYPSSTFTNLTILQTLTANQAVITNLTLHGSGTNSLPLPHNWTDFDGNAVKEDFEASGVSTNGTNTILFTLPSYPGTATMLYAAVNADGNGTNYSDVLTYTVRHPSGGNAAIVRTNHLWSLENHWVQIDDDTNIVLYAVADSDHVLYSDAWGWWSTNRIGEQWWPDFLYGPYYFEETGAPSPWTAYLTVDWDYATDPLEGNQSVQVSSTGAAIHDITTIPPGTSLYVAGKVRLGTGVTSGSAFLSFRNGATQLGQLQTRSGTSYEASVFAAGGTSAHSGVTLTTSAGQWTWFQARIKIGTGSNTEVQGWFSNDLPGSGWSTPVQSSNGTATLGIARVWLYNGSAVAQPFTYDNICISDTFIEATDPRLLKE